MSSKSSNYSTDSLTGLMTSQQFMRNLLCAFNNSKGNPNIIVGMINLDRFKAINDLHGRAAGDAILSRGARRLVSVFGQHGHIARLGGDAFGIQFHGGTDLETASTIAGLIVESLGKCFNVDGKNMFTGASIGLSRCPSEQDISEALRRANKALNLAKDRGRGCCVLYNEEIERSSLERVAIEADLRTAVESSTIEPWFQPIVALEDQKLVGFEVLARWKHSKHWWVPPLRFIETAEDCGLIDQLSLDLFQKACYYAKAWGPNLSISFNISPHQFCDPNLTLNLKRVLLESKLDPKLLTLEITESSVIQEFSNARTKLISLKEMGIQIALDDFGTGFSSLSNLGHLPIDRIKVDRSFVTNIADNPHNQKIVKGILSLANGLNIDVTAEGIETSADLDFLLTQDCSLGQGYLFHRALPASKVTKLLESEWKNCTIPKKSFATLQHI